MEAEAEEEVEETEEVVAAEVEDAVDEEEEAAAAGEEGEGEEEELSRRAGRHLLLQRAVRAWQRRPPAPPRNPMPALTGGALPSQADEAVELLQVRGEAGTASTSRHPSP